MLYDFVLAGKANHRLTMADGMKACPAQWRAFVDADGLHPRRQRLDDKTEFKDSAKP